MYGEVRLGFVSPLPPLVQVIINSEGVICGARFSPLILGNVTGMLHVSYIILCLARIGWAVV